MAARKVGEVWRGTGHWVRPDTAQDVMQVIGSIGTYSTGQQFAWRGMSSCDFRLESSLYRDLRKFDVEVDEQVMRSAEKESLLRARGWGLGVGETDHTDDLQLLADLQHFSVPTRLVDVTSNPMTALWFACQAAPSAVSASGILVALNITGWPHFASLGNPYEMTYDRMDNPKGAALEKAVSDGRPFVVDASVPNARLRAQEGFFVASAHPEQLRPVDSPFVSLDLPYQKGDAARLASALNRKGPGAPRKVPFVAVFINAQLKRKLSKYLEQTYNRSERVLFPDFTGFARWWERLGR